MDPAITIGLRLALYLDLMLLFGLLLFHTPAACRSRHLQRLVPGLALLGLLLSLAAMLQLALDLSGLSHVSELQARTLWMLWTQTAVGQSWGVRLLMLLAVLALAGDTRASHRRWIALGCAGIALATLAWAGHGAMSEGARHVLHLFNDILHLWAAGAWIGALAAFLLSLHSRNLPGEAQVRLLASRLRGFEQAGGLIVFTLLLSGILNHLLVSGPEFFTLQDSLYGSLLLLKLLLFAVMLALAALNRWHLTPQLQRSLQTGDHRPAIAALRRSLTLEASMAVLVLCLVAWLGILSPESTRS
ncbi:putative copper resistance protein D [Pseudomonas sp. NFPP10]|uniref:copper homeostasis membrane protein CopD n=1 Tax=Pseudomonas TaxID=286 RepID=UPI00088967B1|nr:MULTISPECIES: copper homeostasis membrane protein CopD [Pseudomonas]BCQ61920.1 copper resistance protein CopD [Pseudomonas sp. Boi14]POA85722.1 copper resistance protein CopD [Pseudomonas protegens]PZP10258.1 MAG: copper resistance protein CopD [Pseudomonas protegens]ROM13141.1 hypothetical protein BK643_26535 [Pseudomonas protegens]SDA13310.1 putative copper resistance protein D [Pseudomonas sp. NFPP12]